MSEQHSGFEKNWFIVPHRIRKLPGMTLALLSFYETIFEFWNNGKSCFLKNELLMERSGMKSKSCLNVAFQYFEKLKEMKRVYKGNRRYIVAVMEVPSESDESTDLDSDSSTPVDNSEKDSVNIGQGVAPSIPGCRPSDTQGVAPAIHKNNKLNNNKENKQQVGDVDEKVELPSWLDKKDWEDFKRHRNRIKKPMSSIAEQRLIQKLSDLAAHGNMPSDVINESIINGWASFYEIKKTKSNPEQEKAPNRYAHYRDLTAERLENERKAYEGSPNFQ